MATGSSLFTGISAVTNDFYEEAYFTLRETNLLVRTLTTFTGQQGLADRKGSTYTDGNVREIGEDDDVTPTQFNRSLAYTLTPTVKADQYFISDERMRSDDHNVFGDAATNMGGAFADDVDTKVAALFSSLTGGAVGSAGSALTWAQVEAARAILQGAKAMPPFFCALHPYQWSDLFNAASISGTGNFRVAQQFQDSLVRDYFVTSPMLAGVIFVISANVSIDGSDDAIGAMYSRQAMAYDERTPFNIRTQRDESKGGGGTELNASMTYAVGVTRAAVGVTITSDATTPTG